MAAKDLILDPATVDLNRIVADVEEIRRYNPQRFEFEQLTAIVYEDAPTNTCAGYKDITHDEFWVRGHMPGMPIMPGVMMCEAAAQLASYFALKYDLLGAAAVGFGGLEEVRFRDPVIPGDRLLIVVRQVRVRRHRMIVCDFQGFVRETMVVDGVIKGVPLPANALLGARTPKRDGMLFPFHDDNPTSRFPLVTCAFIGLNVASLLYLAMLPALDREILLAERAFVPQRIEQLFDPNLVVEVPIFSVPPPLPQPVHRLQPVRSDVLATLISTMFLHGGWAHLLGNMWFLWLFGNNIEDRLGHVLFILLYVIGGVAASLAHWAMIPPAQMTTPVIGASGAVAAVMGAYAITFPKAWIRCVLVIIIFPIIVELPALLVLGVWFGGQMLDAVAGSHTLTGGVAWWAHVGGFLCGMGLMPIFAAIAPRDDTPARWESAW